MKRKIEEVEDLFESLCLSNKKQYQVVCYDAIETLNDPFDIGQLDNDKIMFTRNEMIRIINRRERILKGKFSCFISLLRKNSWLRNIHVESAQKIMRMMK